MIKRILVGLGGTPYTSVEIKYAVELAERNDAVVTAVTVLDERRLTNVGPVPAGAEGAAHDLRTHRLRVTADQIASSTDAFESAAREAGIRYCVRRETGDEFELLASAARYHDLMIFGLRSIFDYGLHIDPPDALAQLVGEGIRPVLAVAEHYRPIRRVLLAYSGSMESAKTIRRFIQLRPWPDAAVRIVTFGRAANEAQQLLSDMADYCRAHGVEPEVAQDQESPQTRILEVAEEWDADLISLGNSARSLFLRRVLGDTMLHVVRNSDRPLFLSQ